MVQGCKGSLKQVKNNPANQEAGQGFCRTGYIGQLYHSENIDSTFKKICRCKCNINISILVTCFADIFKRLISRIPGLESNWINLFNQLWNNNSGLNKKCLYCFCSAYKRLVISIIYLTIYDLNSYAYVADGAEAYFEERQC